MIVGRPLSTSNNLLIKNMALLNKKIYIFCIFFFFLHILDFCLKCHNLLCNVFFSPFLNCGKINLDLSHFFLLFSFSLFFSSHCLAVSSFIPFKCDQMSCSYRAFNFYLFILHLYFHRGYILCNSDKFFPPEFFFFRST